MMILLQGWTRHHIDLYVSFRRDRNAENISTQKQAASAAAETNGKPKGKRSNIRRPTGTVAAKLSRSLSRTVAVSTSAVTAKVSISG